jgi:putative flippase GtrA
MFLKDPAVGRFLVNGLAATGVHYGVLSLLIEVARMKSAGLANGAAALFGIAASYLGSRYFVFGSGETVARTLPRFLLVYGAVACLHTAVLAVAVQCGLSDRDGRIDGADVPCEPLLRVCRPQ